MLLVDFLSQIKVKTALGAGVVVFYLFYVWVVKYVSKLVLLLSEISM